MILNLNMEFGLFNLYKMFFEVPLYFLTKKWENLKLEFLKDNMKVDFNLTLNVFLFLKIYLNTSKV